MTCFLTDVIGLDVTSLVKAATGLTARTCAKQTNTTIIVIIVLSNETLWVGRTAVCQTVQMVYALLSFVVI